MHESARAPSFERDGERDGTHGAQIEPPVVDPPARRRAIGRGPQRERSDPAPSSAVPIQMFADAVSAGVHPRIVQLDGTNAGLDPEDVHRAAAHGLSGSSSSVPHLTAIQRAFGHHDVTGVQAHIGGPAAEGSAAMVDRR
ncbi:MAG: hypothetical protein ABI437_02895 [Kofleriaceae bacterium]